MASNLQRTDDLHRLKTRQLWLQNADGTFAPAGSVPYLDGDGLTQTDSGVTIPEPGILSAAETVRANTIFSAGPQVGGYDYVQEQGSYMSWNNSIPTGSGNTSFNCQRGAGYGGFIFTIHDVTDPNVGMIQPVSILHIQNEANGPLDLANVRVGINTTIPQYTLDIDGSARINTVPAYSNPGGLAFTAGNFGGQIYASSNDPGFTPFGLGLGLQIDARNAGSPAQCGIRCSQLLVSGGADISGSVVAHDSNGAFGLYSSGTTVINNGSTTSTAILVPNLTSSGNIITSFLSNPTSAKTAWVDLTTPGQFTINLDQNPGADVNIGWLVVKL